jgi:hypothetical protein
MTPTSTKYYYNRIPNAYPWTKVGFLKFLANKSYLISYLIGKYLKLDLFDARYILSFFYIWFFIKIFQLNNIHLKTLLIQLLYSNLISKYWDMSNSLGNILGKIII